MKEIILPYFYGNETETYSFFKLPKILFQHPRFYKMSSDAKLLYSFMLDRVAMSIANNWKDNKGRVFIYYTAKEACELLGKSAGTVSQLFGYLEKTYKIISRKKQGLGKPDIIYVKNLTPLKKDLEELESLQGTKTPRESYSFPHFTVEEQDSVPLDKEVAVQTSISATQEVQKTTVQTINSYKSRDTEIETLDFQKLHTNKTNQNQTNVLRPTFPPSPQPTFPQPEENQDNGTEEWRDLDTGEKSYRLRKALERAAFSGKEDLACLFRSYHTDEEKVELTMEILLDLEELEGYAEYSGELSQENLIYTTTKLYGRALTEMITSRFTNVKGAMIPYSKVIDRLVEHIRYKEGYGIATFDSIVTCTMDAYLDANREVEIKFPLAYMKSCIWSTLLEGNARVEQKMNRIEYCAR